MLCVGTINALFWRYVQNRDWSKEAHTLTGAREHMLHMCIAFWKKKLCFNLFRDHSFGGA